MALPPPHAPTGPAEAPRRRTSLLFVVIAGVVGAGLGLLIGALVLGGDSGGADPEPGPAADAAAGCQLLSGLPNSIPEFGAGDVDDAWSVDGPYLWRVQGASGAFSAAGTARGAYRSLADDGELLYRAIQRLQTDEANGALDDLRDWCADHGIDGG